MSLNFQKIKDGLNLASLAADPANPANGDLYFNTTTNTLRLYNGTAWGSIDTADLSAYLRADGTVPLTGNLNANSHKIINVTDPTVASDASTKNYVDTTVANYLPLAGGTMSGDVNMNTHSIHNVVDPASAQDAATKHYVDTSITAAPFANQTLSNLTSPVAVNQNIAPASDNSLQVGSTSASFSVMRAGRFSGSAVAIATTGDVSNGSAVVMNIPTTNGITTSMELISPLFPRGAFVTSVDSLTQVTVSQVATGVTTTGASISFAGVANVRSENASGSASSGSTVLRSGSASTGSTGKVIIQSGNASSGGTTGDVSILAGTTSGTRGTIYLDATAINASSKNIQSVADPINPQDAATKNYVDTSITSSAGANKTLSNLTSPTAINQNLLPGTTNTITIGSSTLAYSSANINALYNGSTKIADLSTFFSLGDSLGRNSILFDTRVLRDTGNNNTLDYGNRALSDTTGLAAIQWGNAKNDGTGYLDIKTNLISNVKDPVSTQDAATKHYVDAVAQGLKPKQAARAATTANITLSGTQTVDTVVLAVGDRVLVKNQATAANNGVYIVASGAWTRSTDFNSVSPIDEINGASVAVQEGSQAGQTWVQTGHVSTVGTDAINFVFFNSVPSYTAGNGINITGTTISAQIANATLTNTVSGLAVNASAFPATFIPSVSTFNLGSSGTSWGTGYIQTVQTNAINLSTVSALTPSTGIIASGATLTISVPNTYAAAEITGAFTDNTAHAVQMVKYYVARSDDNTNASVVENGTSVNTISVTETHSYSSTTLNIVLTNNQANSIDYNLEVKMIAK